MAKIRKDQHPITTIRLKTTNNNDSNINRKIVFNESSLHLLWWETWMMDRTALAQQRLRNTGLDSMRTKIFNFKHNSCVLKYYFIIQIKALFICMLPHYINGKMFSALFSFKETTHWTHRRLPVNIWTVC